MPHIRLSNLEPLVCILTIVGLYVSHDLLKQGALLMSTERHTNLWACRQVIWSTFSAMSSLHSDSSRSFFQGSKMIAEEVKKDSKSLRQKTIRKLSSGLIWTHSGCDSTHKYFLNSSQKKSSSIEKGSGLEFPSLADKPLAMARRPFPFPPLQSLPSLFPSNFMCSFFYSNLLCLLNAASVLLCIGSSIGAWGSHSGAPSLFSY